VTRVSDHRSPGDFGGKHSEFVEREGNTVGFGARGDTWPSELITAGNVTGTKAHEDGACAVPVPTAGVSAPSLENPNRRGNALDHIGPRLCQFLQDARPRHFDIRRESRVLALS
jgi:hypothetical protein